MMEDILKELYPLIIVDDEWIIRDGLMSLDWQSYGFEAVASAATGLEALSLLEKMKVDLILTDIKMPEMDGLELSGYVHEHFPHCKVIILTGYKDFEHARTAIVSGVSGYLLKPVDIVDLERQVKQVKQQLDERPTPVKLPVSYPGIDHAVSLFINRALAYIQSNYTEKISLLDVAAHVFVTPTYFSIQFKKQTGINFIEYVTQLRIEKAKELLGRPDLKIYEVGAMVGYSNSKYFTDTFKRITHYTPIEYKNKVDP
ncbi:MAG: response regulator [Gorillibacterium sp.]|nr:response regulator [Gorillibacterium sp.]